MVKRWLLTRNNRIQRYDIKSLKEYRIVGKKGRANVYQRIIQRFRTQSAMTGYKMVTSDGDIRVWIHHHTKNEITRPIIEQELKRFTRALRIKGLYDATDIRSEISEPIGKNEIEPDHARMDHYYGFAKLFNYVYYGHKKHGLWVIRK